MSLGKLTLRNRWEKISAGEAVKKDKKKVRAGGGRHFINPLFKALLGALCAWHQDVMSQEVTRWNGEVRELPDEDDKSFWHFYMTAVPAWLFHEVTWTGHFSVCQYVYRPSCASALAYNKLDHLPVKACHKAFCCNARLKNSHKRATESVGWLLFSSLQCFFELPRRFVSPPPPSSSSYPAEC